MTSFDRFPREKKSDPTERVLDASEQSYLNATADIAEQRYAADYGFYPESHSVTHYLQDLLDRSIPEDERGHYTIKVTQGWEEFNAGALPNGTILISDRMLTYCQYEEELQFVLRHEYMHIARQHHALSYRKHKRVDGGSVIDALYQDMGQMRLHEYEADLRAGVDDKDLPYNLYGGIRFLERLVETERATKQASGIVHGDTMDRLLNLHFVTRMVDSAALNRDLTKISPEIIAELESKRSLKSIVFERPLGKGHITPESIAETAKAALRVATPDQLQIIIPELYNYISELEVGARSGRSSTSRTYDLDVRTELLQVAIERMATVLQEELKTVPAANRPALRGLYAGLVYGISPDSVEDTNIFNGMFDFFEDVEDFLQLPALLDSIAERGVYPNQAPEILLRSIIREAGAASVFVDEDDLFSEQKFTDYCRDVVAAVDRLYQYKSDYKKTTLIAAFIAEALLDLSSDEQSDFVVVAAKNLSIKVEDVILYAEKYLHISLKVLPNADVSVPETEESIFWNRIYAVCREIKYMDSAPSKAPVVRASLEKTKSRRELFNELEDMCSQLPWNTMQECVDGFSRLVEGELSAEQEVFLEVVSTYPSVLLSPERFTGVSTARMLKHVLELQNNPYMNPGEGAVCLVDIMTGAYNNRLFDPSLLEWGITEHDLTVEQVHAAMFAEDPDSAIGTHYDTSVSSFDALYRSYFFTVATHELRHLSRAEFFQKLRERASIKPKEGNISQALIFVNEVFDAYSFSLTDKSSLDELLTLSVYVPDFELSNRLQEGVMAALFQYSDTAELEEVLFRDERTRYLLLANARHQFIDERLNTPAALDRTLDMVRRDRLIEDQVLQERVSDAILAEESLSRLLRNPRMFIEIGLSTQSSDYNLKKELLTASLYASTHSETINDSSDLDRLQNLDLIIRRLYEMDKSTKHAVIRKLFVGEHGLLNDSKELQKFITTMCSEHIIEPRDDSEAALLSGVKDALIAVVKNADPSTIYFMLAPFLFEHMFKVPAQQAAWSDIIDDVIGSHDRYHFGDITPDLKKEMALAVSGKKINGQEADYSEIDEGRLRLMAFVDEYAPLPEKQPTPEKLGIIEFTKTIIGQLGAPGVRLMQVIGQYVQMTPELERAFSDVYDSVPGQTKLSAFHTVKREWSSVASELEEWEASVGGGSLATVWKAKTSNGAEALKVLNPNVDFFVDSICDILEKAFSSMEGKYGRKAKLAELAIRDIRAWLHADIQYDHFLERDAVFFRDHNNFSIDDSGYVIRVPKTYGAESRHYKREEWIEGKNLTKTEELQASRHDVKKIIRLLIASTFHQITLGQVHSDIHPGNIRITQNNEVALLDRNFYIELNAAEQEVIVSIIASDDVARKQVFIDYLLSLSENNSVQRRTLTEAFDRVGGKTPEADRVAEYISIAKELEVYVPLKVTILVKNFLALNKLAVSGGFQGINEALFT